MYENECFKFGAKDIHLQSIKSTFTQSAYYNIRFLNTSEGVLGKHDQWFLGLNTPIAQAYPNNNNPSIHQSINQSIFMSELKSNRQRALYLVEMEVDQDT